MKNLLTKLTAAVLALTLLFGVGAPATIASAASKPAKVSSLTVADRDDDEIELKWSKVSGATGYQIYQYNSSTGKWKKIKTTSKVRYEVENLKSATKYQFRVRAYKKANGTTTYGSYSSILTTYTEPGEVKNVTVTSRTNTTIALKWNKVTRATKYQVYVYDTTAKKYVCKTTVSGTTATLTGLTKGTTYKIKVRAYKSANSVKYYGDFSDVLKATTTGTSTTTTTTTTTDIGAAKAKSIALADAGLTESQVTGLKAEKDKEDGVVIYEVEFKAGGYEYEYEINASTGKIIHKEKDRD